MIDPLRLAELDETLERCAQTVPGRLRAFFDGCVASGFTEAQALDLTRAFLRSVLAVPSQPELAQTATSRR